MVNGWGSASEDERNFSSHRSSLGSSSDGSIFTHCSFAQALVAAADKAGYRLEGTSLSKRGWCAEQAPRRQTGISTDLSLSAPILSTVSLPPRGDGWAVLACARCTRGCAWRLLIMAELSSLLWLCSLTRTRASAELIVYSVFD